MGVQLRNDAVMGDVESAQINGLMVISGFENITDTRRFILKLLTITEDYSLGSPPQSVDDTSIQPPKKANRIEKIPVSTNRAAVYTTTERSVYCKLGEYSGDQYVMLYCADIFLSFDRYGETAVARFYRSAVKWYVRRTHH
ncbi:hypothetical protein PHMEG_00031828 [Phytophthora megakarya]|uniref:Uncharacterized protein n=1 Tax=Phytophthora megakarya TaxID=4795 RepID=A0A225UX88_9STRA|nr:hypothetical protein PHMEG_00031828 [Phytophthora megakarya]